MRADQRARAWIGTPYRHLASCRGAGADCLGLVLGVWRDIHGQNPCAIPSYSPSWAETGTGEPLWDALARYLTPVVTLQDGDVLLFRMQPRARAKHLGIQTTNGSAFIHACPRAGVVESPLSEPWARRVVARFSLTLIGDPLWQP
jgi:NlpC/P60 family putative phage cell wall peptidase